MTTSVSQEMGRNKHFWTSKEDKALIGALHELSIEPHWKCENGFRADYMIQLEKKLEKTMPGCELKANPPIDSRLKTLVGKFRAIRQMLGTSGFKWDDERHMISVERSIYDEYCKVHHSCKNLYGVSFHYLNAMMDIYGKDYATGKHYEGFEDTIQNMDKEKEESTNVEKEVDESINLSDDENDVRSPSIHSAPPSKKVKRAKNAKKKVVGTTNSDFESLKDFMKDMNGHLSAMTAVWARADIREQERDERDKERGALFDKVLGELMQLDGISRREVIAAARILTAKPNELKLFFRCPPDFKVDFVKEILSFGASGDGNNDTE